MTSVSELHEIFASQKAAFGQQGAPSLDERRAHLGALAQLVVANRSRIRAAMSADFAVHPELFTDLIEVLGVAGRAAYAAEQQLAQWARTAGKRGRPRPFRIRPRGDFVPTQRSCRQHRAVELPLRPVFGPAGRNARGRQPRDHQAIRVHPGLR